MRILFVLPTLSGGGAEKVASALGEWLGQRHQVHFALFSDSSDYGAPVRKHILNLDQAFASKPTQQFPLAVLRLIEVVREVRPTVVVSFMTMSNILAGIVSLFCGVPHVGSVRTNVAQLYQDSSKNGRFLLDFEVFWLRRAARVVALSEGVRQDLISVFGLKRSKVMRIYNPYIEVDSSAPSEWIGHIAQSASIVHVGRHVPEKGLVQFLRVYKLVSEVTDAKLFLVGEGPLTSELKELVNGLGLSWSDNANSIANVNFVGRVADPSGVYEAAKVVVFPSVLEGFGNVLLEALTCGAFVLASDCSYGPREILIGPQLPRNHMVAEEGSGGLLLPVLPQIKKGEGVSSQAENVWARSLLEALLNPREIGKFSRQSEFELNKIGTQWEVLLEVAASGGIE